jgi:hypothetical protein
MNKMKSIRLFPFATVVLLGFTGIVAARAVRVWPYQELVEKSDLVVLATPTATNDTTKNIDLPGFVGERVIGVETRFAVSAVVKGDKTLREIVFHHYRATDGSNISRFPNGATFVSFQPVARPTITQRTFVLFLAREADGRYAPIVGQTDPGGAVKELKGVER